MSDVRTDLTEAQHYDASAQAQSNLQRPNSHDVCTHKLSR